MENKITGAEALIKSLIAEGVDRVFGYPGGAIIPVYDKLYDYTDSLTHVLVRHEQGAIHAAQGYARVSGRTGVVIVTSGPAATNVMTGLSDAMMDSTPLVVITGQVYASLLGSDAFQEPDGGGYPFSCSACVPYSQYRSSGSGGDRHRQERADRYGRRPAISQVQLYQVIHPDARYT